MPARPRPYATFARLSRGEMAMIAAFWLFMAALSALGAYLDPRGRMSQPGPLPAHVVVPFLQYGLWAVLTPPIFALAARVGTERPRIVGRVLLLLGVGLVVAVGADILFTWLRFDVFAPAETAGLPGPNRRPGVLTGVRRFFFLDDFALYLAVLGAGIARESSRRLRHRHEDALRLEADKARLSSQLSDARLTTLQAQLDPHFLFNTLNAVSALVDIDPPGVRRMIARLSELLRWSLDGRSDPETRLDREIAFLERYAEIMTIRFQGRLDVAIDVPPELSTALVPALVLQPLVENAIKHGIGEGAHGGRVEVRGRRDGADLVLEVLDDGRGPDEPLRENVGLRNTRERLETLYGAAATLSVAKRTEGGTRAAVVLPFHTDTDLRAAAVEGP